MPHVKVLAIIGNNLIVLAFIAYFAIEGINKTEPASSGFTHSIRAKSGVCSAKVQAVYIELEIPNAQNICTCDINMFKLKTCLFFGAVSRACSLFFSAPNCNAIKTKYYIWPDLQINPRRRKVDMKHLAIESQALRNSKLRSKNCCDFNEQNWLSVCNRLIGNCCLQPR